MCSSIRRQRLSVASYETKMRIGREGCRPRESRAAFQAANFPAGEKQRRICTYFGRISFRAATWAAGLRGSSFCSC